jgi:hypothetical protein
MRKTKVAALFFFASVMVCFAHDVPFASFVTNPSKFDKQRVTLTGFLEVGGSENYLWEDPRALRRIAVKRAVALYYDPRRPSLPGTNYPPDIHANRHWVRVTGIAHATCYGRLGAKQICMDQEKIEILSRRPTK